MSFAISQVPLPGHILDSLPVGILLYRAQPAQANMPADFIHFYSNSESARLTGMSTEQISKNALSKLGSGFERLYEHCKTVIRTHKPACFSWQPGLWVHVKLLEQDLICTFTELPGKQEVWMDQLTQPRIHLQELDALTESIKQRGQLLRETSHDLRGNLGALSGMAELLGMENTETEREQIVWMLKSSIAQSTHMLTGLLDYGRLEAGQETVQLTRFDAATLLNDICDSLRPLADERVLAIHCTGMAELMVESDKMHIRRIVQNLILNAVKNTRHGKISVSWGRDEQKSSWWLAIEDTGSGLPQELVAAWNSRAYPAQGDQLKAATGTQRADVRSDHALPSEGIGLRIVRQLGELLKARITVDSIKNKGTTFLIVLPDSYGEVSDIL